MAEATVRAVAKYIGTPYDKITESSIYVAEKGDSLYSIAKKFGVSVDNLKASNNLQNNLISVGQKLVIPGFAPPTLSNVTYVVQKGDSLYSIASKYNTTADEIKQLNNITTNTLNIGQILQIPSSAQDIYIDTSAPSDTYVVQYGDTINSIANLNNIDVNELIKLNNLTDYELYVGQILKLQTYAGKEIIGTDEYVVKKGDSLYSIARLNNTTVEELKRLNNLTSNTLDVGDVLKIPINTNKNDEIVIPTGNTYVVKKGDSLYSIARLNNTTVEELKRLNNINSNTLSIGQILKLPGTITEEIVGTNEYVVKKGDNLYSIARIYNTTVNEIKELNNLTSNLLNIGDIIKIPT